LGNASTWDACTHREIQIPSAWSQDTVTVTVNQGTFQPGETAWLYVTDADGNVNATGLEVQIGESGADDLPPNVAITFPTDTGSYGTLNPFVSLEGTADDDIGLSELQWSNAATGDSGAVDKVSGDWSIWSVGDIPLALGQNSITVRARDTGGLVAVDIIVVTYDPGPPDSPGQPMIF
ncbi:MAG TPA: hypothetical protein P5201_10985, partial [Aminobacteriaceae bacterium]|nr:hypothetical protein [Aminobacteriaceae bacterium]